ncbi:glucosamine-6-phosphate deaminase [Planococcus sp. SSTMD024]|uniref:glucosamine-6-phosphate deaminase n=1 Tax=Planococcus sp. SSTMD024 TaxID=3242163 RepID=UPI00351DB62E
MKLIKVADYNEMSRIAADYVIEKLHQNPKIKLGMPTGDTPKGLYRELISDHVRNGTSYQHVQTFNLDEYIGLSGQDSQSYRHYMDSFLFDYIDIDKKNTHLPKGDAEDAFAEAEAYEKLIQDSGKVELQILGLGGNGHIGFNEPGTPFESTTHVVDLTVETRSANAKFFGSLDSVPRRAITMGIATIMGSEEILLLVSGAKKSEALSRLVEGGIEEGFPASVLRLHPNATIIADEAACVPVLHTIQGTEFHV